MFGLCNAREEEMGVSPQRSDETTALSLPEEEHLEQ